VNNSVLKPLLDFSKHSDSALKRAIDIAKQYGAQIYLLHVITEHLQQCGEDYCLSEELVDQFEEESLSGAKKQIKKEADKIAKKTDVKISFDIKSGLAHAVILSEQKAKKIDLIVIASHGKTGILDYFIGSVADKVIKGAKCPVLVIKP